MTKRKREKDSLCMYVDICMLFVLLYYEPYTKWAFIFFPACSSSGCVWLYWPSWLSQWRWQMVENQRNKVTEHFLFYVTLNALYCQILLYFTLHCYIYIYIYNPRLVCIALCYSILPHMLLYITLSAHISLYYLSMHYIIPHYIHTISPHMPLYFPEFLCITPDLSKFPLSRLQYIIRLYFTHSALYYPILLYRRFQRQQHKQTLQRMRVFVALT